MGNLSKLFKPKSGPNTEHLLLILYRGEDCAVVDRHGKWVDFPCRGSKWEKRGIVCVRSGDYQILNNQGKLLRHLKKTP